MSRTLKIIAVLLAIMFIVSLLFYVATRSSAQTPEEKIAEEWIDTEPIVITETGVQKKAVAAEWLEAIREYLLLDSNGAEIGYITYDELVSSKKTNKKPRTSTIPKSQLPPAPVPVPVPIPIPPAPTPTPVPVPTPTPTPVPPTPTPTPVPVPSPPNATPSPTPTPIPTPTPVPPPPTPIPTPTLPHCTDGLWNGDESDLDCGGSCSTCPPPGNPTYLSCWTNSDCFTGNCDITNAQVLPAMDPGTGMLYNTISQLQALAGQSWIIPYQGRCK